MKKLAIAIFTLVAAAASAVADDYKLEVQDFSELKVTNGINVEYHCAADSAGWVYFSCEPSVSSQLLFSNNKACLQIQIADDGVAPAVLPTLHVYSSALTKVENYSDSTVRVATNVPVTNFKCCVVGNGCIIVDDIDAHNVDASIKTGKGHVVIVKGKTRKAKLTNVGTGPLEAGGMTAREVKATLFGTGDIDCTVSETLTIYGAGSGKIYYKGNPDKVSNRSLGVKAFPVDSDKK